MNPSNKITAILLSYVDSITDLSNIKASDIHSMLLSNLVRPKSIHEQIMLAAVNSVDWSYIDYYIQLSLDKQYQVENAMVTNNG